MAGTAVVLLSGGLDSSTLLHYVKRRLEVADVHALSFRYGQKHSTELAMAQWQAQAAPAARWHCLDMSFLGELIGDASVLTGESGAVPDLAHIPAEDRKQPPTYVPHRNLVLLAMGACYSESAGIGDLFYGAQAQDEYGYWDCTPGFVARLNSVLGMNRGHPVRVHAPFSGMSKHAIIQIGLELGVDYAHTWTCYRGGARPCGTCPACEDRAAAFLQAGIDDPAIPG